MHARVQDTAHPEEAFAPKAGTLRPGTVFARPAVRRTRLDDLCHELHSTNRSQGIPDAVVRLGNAAQLRHPLRCGCNDVGWLVCQRNCAEDELAGAASVLLKVNQAQEEDGAR